MLSVLVPTLAACMVLNRAMMVVDIGSNKTEFGEKKYHVGDEIVFKTNYMAVARLLNSKFIDKRFV